MSYRRSRRPTPRGLVPEPEGFAPAPPPGLAQPLPAPPGCPDLLHAPALLGLCPAQLSPQLSFAFAGGDAAEMIRGQLAQLAPAPSDWTPEMYGPQLFVPELAQALAEAAGLTERCDRAVFLRLLRQPPADPAARQRRTQLLGLLRADTTQAAALDALLEALLRLRAGFLHTTEAQGVALTERKLDTLAALSTCLTQLAGFADAPAPLAALAEAARPLEASGAWGRLKDLLEHEQNATSATIQLQLGLDGRVRRFQLVGLQEARHSQFYRSPTLRVLRRLWFALRGLSFGEQELLHRWLDQVYEALAPALPGLLQLIHQLQFLRAALSFAERAAEAGLQVCLAELRPGPRQLRALFNPLLLVQGVRPVPADLHTEGVGTIQLVTGPNSGGKTRLLQSIGLAQLLAQVGFFTPAAEAAFPPAPALFASLIQDQGFDQAEGRLGTELLRIRALFEQTPPAALVLLDELCSGTNPSEGEQIFRLVIELLGELGPETFVSTHFLGFAERLQAQAQALGLGFLQAELVDRHPSFAFIPGVATTSLAAEAAERLGVSRAQLRALVQRHRRP